MVSNLVKILFEWILYFGFLVDQNFLDVFLYFSLQIIIINYSMWSGNYFPISMSPYLESKNHMKSKLFLIGLVQHQFGFHFQIFSNLLQFLRSFFFSTLSRKLNIALEFSLIFGWFCHKCLVWVGYELKLRGCLVCVFKQLFLVFKQHYTYILHIFSPIYIFINIFKQ